MGSVPGCIQTVDLVTAIRRQFYWGSLRVAICWFDVYHRAHLPLWPGGEFWDMQTLFLRQSRLDESKYVNKQVQNRVVIAIPLPNKDAHPVSEYLSLGRPL